MTDKTKTAKWITLDGIDAVGKTTQLTELQNTLGLTSRVGLMNEFSASGIGDLIRSILERDQFISLAPAGQSVISETLMLVSDFAFKAEVEFPQLQKTSDVILSDRGVLSLIAYQSARLEKVGMSRDESLLWAEDLTSHAFKNLKAPDLNICLFLSMPEVAKRCAIRGEILTSDQYIFLDDVQERLRVLVEYPHNKAVALQIDGLSRTQISEAVSIAVQKTFSGESIRIQDFLRRPDKNDPENTI